MIAWLSKTSLALALALFVALPSGAEDAAPRRAEALAFNCFACHGPHGEGPGEMKSLRTLSAAEIRDKLSAFKRDKQDPTIMNRIAKAYSAEEIALIADYIASMD